MPTGGSASDDKYTWVTSDLWGPDFKAGDVRNSGKLLLFLSLLWESVHSGDKMLLFSQSLLTLDLIERLLGRLPLDCEKPPPPSQSQASQEQLQQIEEEEETEKTVHYRFNRRMGNDPSKQPKVWVRNVHYFREWNSPTFLLFFTRYLFLNALHFRIRRKYLSYRSGSPYSTFQ